MDDKERVRFGSLSTFNAGGLTLLFAYYFKVSNHLVIIDISFVDFLSTDFTCPSISRPGPEAEALAKESFCPGASPVAPGAGAPPCCCLQDVCLRSPVDQKQTSKAGAQARGFLTRGLGARQPCSASLHPNPSCWL